MIGKCILLLPVFYSLLPYNCVSAIFHSSLFTLHSSLFTFHSSLFTLHSSLKEKSNSHSSFSTERATTRQQDLLLRLQLSAHALKSSRITPDATDFIFHGFHSILCCHLTLDLLRIIFAPVRRWIASSKR